MKTGRRVLLALALVVMVAILAFGAIMFSTFQGLSPLPARADLPGGASLVKDGMVAAFVLPMGEGSWALVDCGNDPGAKNLLDELHRRHAGAMDVKAIFLTHGHGDHTAGCHNFPNAEVMALPGDVGLAQGTEASRGLLTRFRKNGPERAIRVTRVLKDGETVVVGALAVQVFAVPGHTSGSAAYLANEVLYLGDSANSRIDGSFAGAPGIFSDSVEENRASLKRLFRRLQDEKAAVKMLAPAHSAPLEGLKAFEAFAVRAG